MCGRSIRRTPIRLPRLSFSTGSDTPCLAVAPSRPHKYPHQPLPWPAPSSSFGRPTVQSAPCFPVYLPISVLRGYTETLSRTIRRLLPVVSPDGLPALRVLLPTDSGTVRYSDNLPHWLVTRHQGYSCRAPTGLPSYREYRRYRYRLAPYPNKPRQDRHCSTANPIHDKYRTP